MTFQRSPSSLSSVCLFYKVDVVVFCEGGPSRTLEEALIPSADGRTLDAIYWSNVVDCQQHDKRFHFKSVGSKETLKQIAEHVRLTNAMSVTVCFDADYDVQLGRMMAGPRLAWTLGYSWESDVLSEGVVARVAASLCGPLSFEQKNTITSSLQRLSNDLVKWCEIDIALYLRSKTCVFDRDNPLSVVDMSANPPWICPAKLSSRLGIIGYKRGPRRVLYLQASTVLRIAYGKLVSRLIYHMVIRLVSHVGPKLKIKYDDFMRIAISETFNEVRSGLSPSLSAHILSLKQAFA